MAATLLVQLPDGTREFPIEGQVTIGRAEDNVVVLDDAEVSRHHGMLYANLSDGFVYVDLGSANGSLVRTVPTEPRVPVPVQPGDLIKIANCTLSVRPPDGAREGARTLIPEAKPSRPAAGATVALPQALPILRIDVRGETREVPLLRSTTSVGRDEANDLVIADDFVSRRHLLIQRTGSSVVVEDAGATNGIRIRGERVTSSPFVDGDVVELVEGVTIQLKLPAAPKEEATMVASAPQLLGTRDMVIGRSAEADLTLEHPTVSLRHALLTAPDADGKQFILDLGSTNGTFVNGARLANRERRLLGPEDEVFIGPVRLIIEKGRIAQRDNSRELGLVAVGLNKQVSKDINLLQNLSIVIEPQEFVALVGVSGSGKSTLLGALSGLRPATKGRVLVNGTSLYDHYEAFATLLGYVPQDDILHKELPVERALEYTAELRLPDDTNAEERKRIITSVLHDLSLDQRRTVPVGRLSGGQRKRVSIGAELITQPGLFFLDEATSGLDPGTESQLMRLLRKLADEGHTIVLITHATKNVMLCDQVIFLAAGGNLAYFGPPDRALTYFGVSDFDQIYEKLDSEPSTVWAERYRQSQNYTNYIEGRLRGHGLTAAQPGGDGATQASAPVAVAAAQPPPAAGRASARRQLGVLVRRYFDILRRDRVTMALVLLLAPVLGAVDLVTWPRDNLDVRTGNSSHAMSMLFIWALIPFLVGALSFVREIVKESAIYERERAVALGVWPYLLSKLMVAVPLAMYHAGALFVFKLIGVDLGGVSTLHLATLYGTLVLAVLSGVMFALLISTVTAKEEQAMMLVIGVIVLQIVLSGGIVPLSSLGPPGAVLSKVTSTSWSYKALATSAGITTEGCSGDFSHCRLPGMEKLPTTEQKSLTFSNIDDSFGDVLDANIAVCWGAMGGIIVVVLGSLYVFQKRKDTL